MTTCIVSKVVQLQPARIQSTLVLDYSYMHISVTGASSNLDMFTHSMKMEEGI